MLRRVKHLIGFTVRGVDQEMGRVKDLYFCDTGWALQHLVVHTGLPLFGQDILVAPAALGTPVWEEKVLPVKLSKEQVTHSPRVDLEEPISTRALGDLYRHYGWPAPWTEDELLGTTYIGTRPEIVPGGESKGMHTIPGNAPRGPVDRHLYSAQDILGYDVLATDGRIGHVEDLFVDESGWIIRYVLVDAREWLPGRRVLVSTDWVARVGWTDNHIQVDLTRDQVENSPEYDLESPLDRDHEIELYGYYGLPGYWV
jgi:uncharacterized protein YrrD